MGPEHAHHRSNDFAGEGRIYVPGWAKGAAGIVVAIIVATVATLSWMDNRYAKSVDTASKADVAVISQKIDTMSDDLKDIKRAIYHRNNQDDGN